MISYLEAHGAAIFAIVCASLKGLQYLVAGILAVLVKPPKWLLMVKAVLDDICPNLPTKNSPAVAAAKATLLAVLLLALPARAQVVTSGPSVPLVLVYPSNPHPVQVAQGAGYGLMVGFCQFAALGKSWDALDILGEAWGTVDSSAGVSSGGLTVAPMVGTLNGLLAVGMAIPIYSAAGGALANGQFRPGVALSLTIPLSFGPYSPPVGIATGAEGMERGGTIYLGERPAAVAQPPAAVAAPSRMEAL